MSEEKTKAISLMTDRVTAKDLFSQEKIRDKFKELLGKRAPQFITSVLQIIASNSQLVNADPMSIYNSAAMAATLDLPLNNSLGMAYIVPYNNKQADGTWAIQAQFQIGYKGYKQLALRSGQFLLMNASDVRAGEIVERNRLTGEIKWAWTKDDEVRRELPIIGYVSFFQLVNGFSKTHYMSSDEVMRHAKRFSKNFAKNGLGLWKDDFDKMALKTVTKLNFSSGDAPLSIQMQLAIAIDQAILRSDDGTKLEYPDNEDEKVVTNKKAERMIHLINDATTLEELYALSDDIEYEQMELFKTKEEKLKNK